ncbi:transposase [Natrinema hispanicum]|uniref:Transposase domain n=1 Tax=Natrinema hispanicum TaxID=392421 RepID=A0A1I0ITY0_9EURY|nr:transposase [Natrinema hispanicum]SDD86193.1 Transposase domain [Natrinema hispanicum]SET99774.1 Transposase domain [Natrinema hispanicum]SEU00012.1 Transposase domain [Natrinema hispanicum]SEU06595.1 Transposase domain [Natrinema hispanicum]SEU13277.1 Transposase domain [Natrinema hispanicum]
MFKENNEYQQEALFSPVKDLQSGLKTKLQNHWSTHFYEHVFTQIDEKKFGQLYHDGYSRPNKPVNELVSLEIIKHLLGLSDEQLEHAYLFDFRVRNALGKETLGDNICAKTFTNFRRRLLEHEEETGQDLLHEVFQDHRSYLQDEFEIDASTQRMDSTFIEANIKQLSRIDLIAKVVHNFLDDLPDEIVQELPAGLDEFADTENLELSYELEPGEINSTMETLIEHATWLIDRFEEEQNYAELESFAHLQQILDEQCYRIPELEDDDRDHDEDDDDDHPGDSPSPGWEPLRTFTSSEGETGHEQASDEPAQSNEDDHEQDRVGLKEPDEISSGSMQNPHDVDATHRRKGGESFCGYKANVAETCGGENPFRLITTIRVDTNNTDDGDLLAEDVPELPEETGLTDLLVDGGYTHKEVEACCDDHGITQHFTGLTGQRPPAEKLSLADAEWDDHRMVACPAGHEPFEQRYMPESGRISGRMGKEFCEDCPHRENCFVREKQKFYSYGFYERKLALAHRRKRLDNPAEKEFLNLRAGAESLVNEVYYQDGEKARFTGTIKVKNASIAKAIGTNLKRASRFLESEAKREHSAG